MKNINGVPERLPTTKKKSGGLMPVVPISEMTRDYEDEPQEPSRGNGSTDDLKPQMRTIDSLYYNPDEEQESVHRDVERAMVTDVDAKLLESTTDEMRRGIFKEVHYKNLDDYLRSDYYRKFRENAMQARALYRTVRRMQKLRESKRASARSRSGKQLPPSGRVKFGEGIFLAPSAVRRLLHTKTEKKLRESLKKVFKEDAFDSGLFADELGGPAGQVSIDSGRVQEFIPILAGPYNKQLYYYDYLKMHALAFEAWCLTGETKIALLDGRNISILQLRRELEKVPFILGHKFNKSTGLIEPVKLVAVHKMGKKQCAKVGLDKRDYFTGSTDHPMLLRDGTYEQIGELLPGTKLFPLRKVKFVEFVGSREVYHIETDEKEYANQNFALSCGVFSHNTHNPLAKRICRLIPQFVLGGGVVATVNKATYTVPGSNVQDPNKPKNQVVDETKLVQECLDSHYKKNKMSSRLRLILRELLIFGEQMIRYFPTDEGYMIRQMDPSTVWDIITDPDNVEEVFYYHMQYPCLHGSTKISLLNGEEVSIKRMVERFAVGEKMFVYSYDRDLGRVVPGEVEWAGATGKKRCVRVLLDNGEKVVCSYDHPFMSREGQYVPAEKLKPGDSLMPLYRQSGYERVWQPKRMRWEYTHRVVAHAKGWKKDSGLHVHHFDENKGNNSPDNILVMTDAEHRSMTLSDRWNPAKSSCLKNQREEAKRASIRRRNKTLRTQRNSKPRRRLMSQLCKNAWANPEIRARRLEGLRRGWIKRRENPDYFSHFNHKVVSVEEAGTHLVYDLTVKDYHNFALSAGVFVSNTQYQWFINIPVPSIRYIIRQVPSKYVIHFKINAVSNEKRGRSELFAILGWLKRHKDFVHDRVVLNKVRGFFGLDVAVKGGRADVEAVNNQFQKPFATGSYFVHSDTVTLAGVNAELQGADSKYDADMIVTMIALGAGISEQYLGLAPATTKASALVGTEPDSKNFEDYQNILEEFLQADANKVFDYLRDIGKIRATDIQVEFTFPEVAQGDRSTKLKDIAFNESMSYITHRRAATMSAKEMKITNFDYSSEMADLKEEEEAEVDINKTYAQIKKGDSGEKGQGGITMNPGGIAETATPISETLTTRRREYSNQSELSRQRALLEARRLKEKKLRRAAEKFYRK